MKVIGIDVGPGKGGHVCDGQNVQRKRPDELEKYLSQELPKDVLIAWDAPLTGPTDLGSNWSDKDLTCRQIESFFSLRDSKPPRGISIRPYSNCPHWTITRRLLGLPRVGPYDSPNIPFALIEDDDRPTGGRHVVEVHPAMALWRWYQKDTCVDSWTYKKNKDCLGNLAKRFGIEHIGRAIQVSNDDDLDAWIAWYLADRWLNAEKDVMLLGNARTGSFLLPYEPALKAKFDEFVSSPQKPTNKELAKLL